MDEMLHGDIFEKDPFLKVLLPLELLTKPACKKNILMKYPLKREREYRDDKVLQITARNFAYEMENELIKVRTK